MFTGLIEELGTLVDLISSGTSLCLKIEAGRIFSEGSHGTQSSQNGLKIGDSIAVNGVCLTATNVEPSMTNHSMPYFEVTAVEETLRKTTLGSLIAGNEVNLERAATLETRLGGHLVQGHVDRTAIVTSIRDVNGSWEFSLELPSDMLRYVVPKGSIALDGISLTVAAIEGNRVTVAIIPHTYYHTNIQFLNVGDAVNVEFDIIAKMVEQLVKPYSKDITP